MILSFILLFFFLTFFELLNAVDFNHGVVGVEVENLVSEFIIVDLLVLDSQIQLERWLEMKRHARVCLHDLELLAKSHLAQPRLLKHLLPLGGLQRQQLEILRVD